MKKLIYARISLFLVLIVIFSTYNNHQIKKTKYITTKKIINNDGLVNISIDPKVELLIVVQYLSNDKTIVNTSNDKAVSDYIRDIDNYFYHFKDDTVVKLYKEMNAKDFSYDTPLTLLLYTDDTLKLDENMKLPERTLNYTGGRDRALRFLKSLSEFNIKSNFNIFFNKHIEFYNKIVAETRNKLNKTNCIDKLINYYGYEQKSYNIIIDTLSNGGYGIEKFNKKGGKDLYALIGLNSDEIDFTNIVIHEFGHSYIDSLTDQYIENVNKFDYLFDNVTDKIDMETYGEWNVYVNELLVRSVTYKLINEIYGNDIKNQYINHDKEQGFIYLTNLYNKLTYYENNRDQYKTFDNFYMDLINTLYLSDK